MSEWQDISTAPNDGTEVLVSDGSIVWISSRVACGEKGARGEPPLWRDWNQPTIFNIPVEWQPLPKPTPKAADGVASATIAERHNNAYPENIK